MLDVILERLEELATVDTHFDVFGSGAHRYRRVPLTASDLDAFESQHGVRLPGPYRTILEHIGIGRGPAYGLLPPAPINRADGRCARRSEIGRPFPLTRAWANTTPEPWPEAANRYDGCIKLVELGCGYFDLLVVHGPKRGEVWTDWTEVVGAGELAPKATDVLAWYDEWLGRALREWATAELVRAVRRQGEAPSPRLLELTEHLEQETGDNRAALARGYRHLLLGDLESARAAFEQYAAHHPASGKGSIPSHCQALCDLHRVRGDLDARLEAAERGLERQRGPDRPRLLWEKEDVLRARGDLAGALGVLRERARTQGAVEGALGEYARELRELGRLDELDPLVDEVVDRRLVLRRASPEQRRAHVQALVSRALAEP